MYKIQRLDSGIERSILIGLIVDDMFLTEAVEIINPTHFRVPAFGLASKWCSEFWEEFSEAPKLHFKDIYESKKRAQEFSEEISIELESLFADLSQEYVENPQINRNYLLKQLEKLMRSRSLLALGEDLIASASRDSEEAESLLYSYKPVTREAISWSDPFALTDSQLEAMESDSDVLFRFPGAMGELIGPIERDSFIGIQAPEKRGKTWYLMEFALRGVLNRCNVAFFSVGDMSELQVWRRIYGWVLKSSRRYGGRETLVPVLDCKKCQRGECDFVDEEPIMDRDGKLLSFEHAQDHTPCTKCLKDVKNSIEFESSLWYVKEKILPFLPGLAREKLLQLSKRCGGKQLRLKCFPSNSANVKTIKNLLDVWEKKDSWIADVVVIDYADILAPEDSRESETRHQINKTWASLRGLSIEKSIAVITATQAAKTSYTKSQQDTTDVSEDKRKLGHVTSMLGINQTREEKKAQITRFSQLIRREDDFDMFENVVCLQCLKMSRPLLQSYWLR